MEGSGRYGPQLCHAHQVQVRLFIRENDIIDGMSEIFIADNVSSFPSASKLYQVRTTSGGRFVISRRRGTLKVGGTLARALA